MPEERAKLRISRSNYLTMLLPFTIVLSAKLFLQNKAVQYVSPAFYAMTGQLLPVGVTIAGFLTGSQRFKWSTVCAAAVVSVGGVLIKAGQMELSPFGFILTMSSLGLDVVRLLLMQYLLQHRDDAALGAAAVHPLLRQRRVHRCRRHRAAHAAHR